MRFLLTLFVRLSLGSFGITFEDEPERQPGFLIKATEVEFLSPRKAEEEPQALDQPEGCEAA